MTDDPAAGPFSPVSSTAPGHPAELVAASADRRRERLVLLAFAAAAAVGVASAAAIAWWLIGDQSVGPGAVEGLQAGESFDDVTLDYLVQFDEPAREVVASVIVGSSLVLAVLLAAALMTAHQRVDSDTALAIAAVLGSGLILGATVRFATAGVIGANIGGGLSILISLVSVPLLIWFAVDRLRCRSDGGWSGERHPTTA